MLPALVREQAEGNTTAFAAEPVGKARQRIPRQEVPQGLDVTRRQTLGHIEPQQPLRLKGGSGVQQPVDRRRPALRHSSGAPVAVQKRPHQRLPLEERDAVVGAALVERHDRICERPSRVEPGR